jgi:hypothetical protein
MGNLLDFYIKMFICSDKQCDEKFDRAVVEITVLS